MPDMNGMDLAHDIQRGWPDLPVLLMSGYEAPELLGVHRLGDVPLLRKHFAREELLEVVAAAVSRQRNKVSPGRRDWRATGAVGEIASAKGTIIHRWAAGALGDGGSLC